MRSRRSAWFDVWLRRQPVEKQQEIRAAEKAYAVNHEARLASEEVLFAESMTGPIETPADGTREVEW